MQRNKLSFLFCVMLALASIKLPAQEVISTDKGNVNQDPKISKLLESHKEWNKRNAEVSGFRIQINTYTSRAEAMQIRSVLMQKYPDLGVYFSYKQPTYRVRLGDYRNRFEAHGFLLEIRKDYPAAALVPDDITPTFSQK